MSNQVFRQNLNDKKGPQPGGPYLIQMLFKEPVEMPDKEKMTEAACRSAGCCLEGVSAFAEVHGCAGLAVGEHQIGRASCRERV